MFTRQVRSRLATIASVLAITGLAAFSPLSPAAPARADVAAGDIIFAQEILNTQGQATASHIEQLSNGTETQLSNLPSDWAQYPNVSADGSRIVFQDNQVTLNSSGQVTAGGQGIWAMNSNGTDQVQLTFPDEAASDSAPSYFTDSTPVWSPDGSKIAFQRATYDANTPGGQDYRIYTMNADGTNVQDLTPNDSGDYNPVWSPDGTQIAFSDGGGTQGISVMNADGTNEHVIDPTTVCGLGQYPQWTSANTIFVLASGNACSWNTHLAKITSSDGFTTLAGSTETDLGQFSAGSQALDLSMSADASTAYMDSGNGNLYSMDVATGTTSSPLTSDGEYNSAPSPVDATWPNANTKTIVALGDSVAAGEGISYGYTWNGSGWAQQGSSSPTWVDTTPSLGANYQDCHQSGLAYSDLFAVDGGNSIVDNMACSGASVKAESNQLGSKTPGGVLQTESFSDGTAMPAELGGTCSGCTKANARFDQAIKSASPYVLLTVGADDIDFSDWLHQCYTAICGTTSDTGALNAELTNEESDLRAAISQINTRAGQDGFSSSKKLPLVVTDYYNPFGSSWNSSCIDTGNNAGASGPSISSAEQNWIINGLTSLDDNISAEVTYAKSNDSNLSVKLVDLAGLFTGGVNIMSGHTFCSNDPWAYGPSIDYPSWENLGGQALPAPFHPTPEGQQAIYQQIASQAGV